MSGSKKFEQFAVIITALMLVVTFLFMNGAALGITVMAHTMGYETRLFDNSRVHTLDIVMDNWDTFISNAISEEYSSATIVIDGESYKNVGIRAKGNTSLSTVASLGSQRYSFKIEFDHYDSSKSYHGLDKLSLNNLIQDSTMMKDYLTYTMMNAFDVHSSLCSYVFITVNGEDWGLYLAVEGVEESFLERNYGPDYGNLYKPDSSDIGGGRGNGGDFNMADFDFDLQDTSDTSVDGNRPTGGFDPSSVSNGNQPNMPSGGMDKPDGMGASGMPESGMAEDFDPSAMVGGDSENAGFSFGGNSGMGSSDVKLQYIDEELSSYSNIWDNAKTDITEADQLRLIASLKKLSANEDLSSVVDVEQVIRYFVVHNFVCNGDSYTGSMVHNYYLYEKDGTLSMIPWDYNLAYGTFQGNNATQTVNTAVDAPVENGSGADRPMWNWIVSNESYTELYHSLFADFLDSVDISGIIDQAYALIRDYVKKDPTAFYSSEEFESGVETLRQFCSLRQESIAQQLQTGDTVSGTRYADATAIQLSDMGSMGGNQGGDAAAQPGDLPGSLDPLTDNDTSEGDAFTNGKPDSAPQMPDDFDPSGSPEQSADGMPEFGIGDSENSDFSPGNRPGASSVQMPDQNSPQQDSSPVSDRSSWFLLGVSIIILATGLLLAKKYRA